MSLRQFTRLTNAFSKKVDNLKAALALHFMHYNLARIHRSLGVTPAMEAGVAGPSQLTGRFPEPSEGGCSTVRR